MPSNKEIEHLIMSLKRAINFPNHGMLEVSVEATKEILNVLIAYLAEHEDGDENGKCEKV